MIGRERSSDEPAGLPAELLTREVGVAGVTERGEGARDVLHVVGRPGGALFASHSCTASMTTEDIGRSGHASFICARRARGMRTDTGGAHSSQREPDDGLRVTTLSFAMDPQ